MLDIGWSELLVIAIVMIVVVGPKDLPPMLRAFGKMTANLRRMAGDFRHQFDEALREADMDDVRKTIADAKSLNPASSLRDALNPLRQMGEDIRSDIQKATVVPSASAVPSVMPVLDEAPEPLPAAPVSPVSAATPVAPAVVAEVAKPKRVRKNAAVKDEVVTPDKPAKTAAGRGRKAEGEASAKKTAVARKKKTGTGKDDA